MKDASQYPITLVYGATSSPYGTPAYPYHRGTDYGCPNGTPVVVNGVQIGLSGHTGFVTGPHLHVGHFINGKDVDPKNQGFSVPGAKVTLIERNDPINGNDVHLRGADGTDWVYLHLSRIDVSEGQIIEGDDMSTIGDVEARILIKHIYGYTNEVDIESAIPALLGGESNTIIRNMDATQTAAAYQAQIKAWATQTPANFVPYSGPQLYDKK